ncbi:MAG: hypothetical protein V2A76_18305 [Planctomycetota bacterium]
MSIHNMILISGALLGLLQGATVQAMTPEQEAQRAFREASEQLEQSARDCFKETFRELKARLREIRQDVASGELCPLLAIRETNAAAAAFARQMNQHAEELSCALSTVGSLLLSELGSVPCGFLEGDGGTWDQFLRTMRSLYAECGARGDKKIRRLAQWLRGFLGAGGGVHVDITIRVVIVLPPPVAPPGPVPPPPPQPPRFTSISSAHDAEIANDGKMSVRGTGPRNGVVTVNIRGPNGVNITRDVPTDGDGNFQVGFPSLPGDGNPGNLPEGNYRVTLTSNGQTASQFHGV